MPSPTANDSARSSGQSAEKQRRHAGWLCPSHAGRVIHHGAEISLLRDLYRWQRPSSTDALTERAIRGDQSLLAEIESVGPETASALLSTAASFGRWALVEGMIDRGVNPAIAGRTPAHAAAGAGELDLLRKLVDHGADLAARDPDFDATPLTWARFIDRPHVVAWLEELDAPE